LLENALTLTRIGIEGENSSRFWGQKWNPGLGRRLETLFSALDRKRLLLLSHWVWRLFVFDASSNRGLQYYRLPCIRLNSGGRDHNTRSRFAECVEWVYRAGDGNRQWIPGRNQFLACIAIYAFFWNAPAGYVLGAGSRRNLYC
jgi:hypothetical protein